jgi:hypothetical protein
MFIRLSERMLIRLFCIRCFARLRPEVAYFCRSCGAVLCCYCGCPRCRR